MWAQEDVKVQDVTGKRGDPTLLNSGDRTTIVYPDTTMQRVSECVSSEHLQVAEILDKCRGS